MLGFFYFFFNVFNKYGIVGIGNIMIVNVIFFRLFDVDCINYFIVDLIIDECWLFDILVVVKILIEEFKVIGVIYK